MYSKIPPSGDAENRIAQLKLISEFNQHGAGKKKCELENLGSVPSQSQVLLSELKTVIIRVKELNKEGRVKNYEENVDKRISNLRKSDDLTRP